MPAHADLAFPRPVRSLEVAPLALGCLAIAAVAAVASPLAALVLIVGGLVAVSALVWPEVALLSLLGLNALFFGSTVVTQGLPVMGGSIKATDVLLLAALAGWAGNVAVTKGAMTAPSAPVTAALAAIAGLSLVALVTAHFAGNPLQLALFELRPLLGYLLVLPLMGRVRTGLAVQRLLFACFAVAIAATVLVIARYATGQGEMATFAAGSIRVRSVNFLFPLLVFVCPLAYLERSDSPRRRLLLASLSMLGCVGLFATSDRSSWLVAGVLLMLTIVLSRARGLLFGQLTLIAALIAGVLFSPLARTFQLPSDPAHVASQRIASIASSRDTSSSYRVAEWRSAADAIESHPVFGLGLGASVAFYNPMYSDASQKYGSAFSTYYIENSYIWAALKLGLGGVLALVALLVASAARLSAALRLRGGEDARIARCALVALVGVALLSITDQHLSRPEVVPFVAALVVAAQVLGRRMPGPAV